MTLETLAAIAKHYDIVQYLRTEKAVSKLIRKDLGLTKKQFYTSMLCLKKNNIVKRNAQYYLTEMAKDILVYVDTIEKLESKTTEYKMIQSAVKDLNLHELYMLKKKLGIKT